MLKFWAIVYLYYQFRNKVKKHQLYVVQALCEILLFHKYIILV